MKDCLPLSLLILMPSSSTGQGKFPGMAGEAVGYGGHGISLTWREAEKMSNIIPHILPSHSTLMILKGFKTFTPLCIVILSCKEAWPNDQCLPGHVGHGKSIKYNKVLGSWD